MRFQISHLLRAQQGTRAVSLAALASGEDGAKSFLLPGCLPCGDCGACRRALVAACARPLDWLKELGENARPGATAELPERFVHELAAAVEPATSLSATVGSLVLEAAGRAGLGPGQLALWLGDDGLAEAGAGWSRVRGCPTGWLRDSRQAAEVARVDAGIEDALRAAPGGFLERCLFVTASATHGWPLPPAHWLQPGTTVVYLAHPMLAQLSLLPAAATLALPVACRAIHLGGRPHPDFLPETLAALARGDLSAATLLAAGLSIVSGAPG